MFFLSFSVAYADTVRFFSLDWSYPAFYEILPRALDSFGQVVCYGSHAPAYPTNFLYARNVSNGNLIWQYNTILPVNYVTHFNSSGNLYVIAATGGSTTSGLLHKSYVVARAPNTNMTLWQSNNLNSSVTSLGSAESNVTSTEDVVAGLENGTVVRLSGKNNGAIQWRHNCVGTVYDIVQLNNGSVVVGTLETLTGTGHIYCFEKNGALRWSYTPAPSSRLTLVKRFGDVDSDGVPEVVAVFTDGLIHVLDGATGQEIVPRWPFSVGDDVKDLLCAQDYTGDGFPDIVAGTANGSLIIVNGRDATRFRGPAQISSFTLSYIQYMQFYKNGIAYSNKTLAVSLQENATAYFIRGINATTLSKTKEYSINGTARNLFNIGNFTSNFTGDLVFSVDNMVYSISGTEIIFSEFPSEIILVLLIGVVWFLVAVLRRAGLRIDGCFT